MEVCCVTFTNIQKCTSITFKIQICNFCIVFSNCRQLVSIYFSSSTIVAGPAVLLTE